MNPQVTLRPATPSDAPLFYAVIDQTMRNLVVATWGAWDEERVSRESLEDSSSPNAQIILVKGQDAGVLAIVEEEAYLDVQQVYLLPAYQRQGVGSELMTLVAKRSSVLQKPVRLRVLRVNPARKFYEKLGFRVTEASTEFFQMERAA
jgi:ribosomal protein S18 acetylase RimI-like enzyme